MALHRQFSYIFFHSCYARLSANKGSSDSSKSIDGVFKLISTDTDQNTGNLNTGIHYNTGKKAYDEAFYLLITGNGNTGIVLGDFDVCYRVHPYLYPF